MTRLGWRARGAMAACAAVACVAALGALRTAGAGAIGLRTGFSTSPGQWVVGLHEQLMDEHASIAVVPSAEAGFGHDAVSLTAQGDVVYRFPHTTGPRPYVGAGGVLYYFNPKGAGSSTNGGLNLVGGVVLDPQSHPRVLIDARVRLTDRLPKARVVVGLEF